MNFLAKSACRNSNESWKYDDFLTNNILKNFKIVHWHFFWNKSRQWFFGKYEIESKELGNLIAYFRILGLQGFQAKGKNDYFLEAYSFRSPKLSIEIMMEELKSVISKKNELQCQKKPIPDSRFWLFRLITVAMQEQKLKLKTNNFFHGKSCWLKLCERKWDR